MAAGTYINSRNSGNEWTPLHVASFEGNKKIVELLVAEGADVDARDRLSDRPIHYAITYKYKDIVFQDDKRPSKPNQINLCAGFMLIKSNKKMLKFFNPENIPTDLFDKYKTHDQTYINKSKSKFNYNILSLESFPNGPKFYENHKSLDPSIIHFNYVRGDEKISLMKKYNEWYF